MPSYKNDRLASILKAELSELLTREYEWNSALVTVIDVQVEKDGLKANVKIGIIPSEKELESYRLLEKHRKGLEHKLLKNTRVRRIPTLHFQIQQNGTVAKW